MDNDAFLAQLNALVSEYLDEGGDAAFCSDCLYEIALCVFDDDCCAADDEDDEDENDDGSHDYDVEPPVLQGGEETVPGEPPVIEPW